MKKAALLAAGDSTRMMPLSANTPKHLLPVAGKPFIFHTLTALRDAGIKETLIIRGYHGEELKKAIDSEEWNPMEVSYITQTERKGTAHAASHARDFAGDDEIILMNGDIMTGPGSLNDLIKHHRQSKISTTLSVKPIENAEAYGIVVAKDGKATGLIEKPKREQMVSNLVNAGIYAVGTDLWDAIEKTNVSARGEYEITDSISMLIEEGKVGVCPISSWWLDIGKPWDLLRANELILNDMAGKVEGEVEPHAIIKGEVIIEKSALVRSGAYIQGPSYIGPDCVVGPNCYIRPFTYLERNVKVGNGCEVKNSIIMEGSSIGHLSYVGDSIIGRKVNFGAGTITANLRHDDNDVKVTIKGKRISSGRRKLGAIIGDHVKTGIGTLLSPGVVLHQNAQTSIGAIVKKDIKPP